MTEELQTARPAMRSNVASARLKVLVVGPGQRVRGGITSVILAHQASPVWPDYQCEWIETYDDRGTLWKIWSALRAYCSCLFKVPRASIVHIHLAAQVSLLRKLPIVCWSRLLRKPFLIHLHAASPESLFEQTPQWAVRFVMLSANRVVTLSEQWAKIVRHQLPNAHVAILPNPVIMPAVDAGDTRQHASIVLFAGKLEDRKGYADLLQAAFYVLQDLPDAQFWFAGHGELQKARSIARNLGIENACQFFGWVGKEELTRLRNESAVFCLPSYDEGVPMAMLEAMSHGVPVICTPVGGIPDIVQHEVNGLLVEPGDTKALASTITRLFTDKSDLGRRLGNAGRCTVLQQCSLDRVAQELDQLYRDCLPQSQQKIENLNTTSAVPEESSN